MSLETDQRAQTLATFLTLLQGHYERLPESDGLKAVRSKAWERFKQIGLPTAKTDLFRTIRLHQLLSTDYAPSHPTTISHEQLALHILPECRHSVLVFINGHYSPDHSNLSALSERTSISSFNDAKKAYGSFLNNQWTKILKEEADPFALLNAALQGEGTFIYVSPKASVEAPLQILNVIDAPTPLLAMPRLHLFLGAHSQMESIATTALISGKGYGLNQVVDIHLEEGANLHHTQVSWEQPHDAWHFDALRAHLKRHSSLKTVQITSGSSTVRHDYQIALAGENCEADLNGACLLKDKRESHVNVHMEHIAPNTRSNQLFKGVLSDFSRSGFEGKIYVHQAAQKTEAFQLNSNLLLSERAYADSKPNLEIFADDVKASHGATIGQLDPEQLFYMRTRGISNEEAKKLIVYSFFQEVLEKIKLPSLRQKLALKIGE